MTGPSSRRAATVGALVALACASCADKRGSSQREPPASVAPAAPRRASPSDAPAPRAAPSLVVTDSGEPPRAQLRYSPPSRARRFEVVASVRARTLTGPAPAEGEAMPPLVEAMVFTAEPSRSAALRLRWRGLPSASSDSRAAPYLAPWQRLLAGRSAIIELSERGALGDLALFGDIKELDSDARDELEQRLLGWLVPLPEEAVGVGARWTVVTSLRSSAGALEQTARYELAARAGAALRIKVDIRRVAEGQQQDASSLAPGAVREVVTYFRAVSGELTIALDDLLPRGAAALEVRSHQRLRLASGQLAAEVITEDLGTLELRSRLDD